MTLFPSRWPVEHPDRLQLYSLATPNGQKVAVALEELGLPYEAHRVNILAGEQFDEDYVAIQPNSKIPALIDPTGDDGAPLALQESGAILLHLADKAGKLLPADGAARSRVIQWLFFQVGSVGPMFGQFGHFYRYATGTTDTYGQERYGKEVTRLLGVLERQLEGRDWIADTYSIADIALVPWIDALAFYEGHDFVGYGNFPRVHAWRDRFHARPAVQRGLKVCPFET